ncbi:hypothetical protein CASFOL_029246 [Castilleja foliolosa]|uniref:DUF8039 domain-containing protein n=1 Tax=Castilleja foliolosa TaxID=1961234 RepID=A0ABD3CDS2_9LAMI
MARMTSRNPNKVKVVFENPRLMPVGPDKTNVDNWSSYLGFLGRKEPSILICSWKKVLDTTKELIWQGILLSENDKKVQTKFKKKWIAYVGGLWSAFKTNLTSDYIYGDKQEAPYLNDYKFLDKVTWDAFVALRLSPEEKAKRQRGKEVQSHNKCPQRTSRGGYEVLSKKIMDEKMKERQAASQDPSEIIPPPSPPTRHEKWKRARLNKAGEYINPEVKEIAERIDSLEEQESAGSFKASGTNDLLAVAIGKPDHPCRVRGVGRGYTVSSYFEKQRRHSGMVSREEFNNTIATMAEMEAKLQMLLTSEAFSSREPLTPVADSAKGSNLSAAPNHMESDERDEEHIGEYGLYVEDPDRRLVAYGHIHELGSTIHNMKMKADEVRVTAVRVVVDDAEVPFPTEEVTTVGEVPNNFIVWPRRLIESIGRKGLSQKELFPKPKSKPDTEADPLKTLWYLYTLLRLSDRNNNYGLISPLHGNSEEMLQKRIEEGDFECFLAPVYETNWQLMALCPKYNYVAWFCFKQNRPTKKIITKIETAFHAYQIMKGTHSRQFKKLQWVYPKCYGQEEGNDCGLLVMRHMLEIIKLDIVNSFEKAFNMNRLYSKNDIDVVLRHWAECFLEYYLEELRLLSGA